MAQWPQNPTWTSSSRINAGQQYQTADGLTASDMVAIVENIIYLYNQPVKTPRNLGEWDITKDYDALNTVYYAGSSYMALVNVEAKDVVDINDTRYWMLLASAGATGAQGAPGTTPDVSATATVDNNTGTPGVEVTNTSTDVTKPNFKFVFTNLKGDTGEAGADGKNGTDGSVWYSGDAPGRGDSAFAKTGDYYLVTTEGSAYQGVVYRKETSGWSNQGSIRGAAGTTGAAGANGKDGATWFVGADTPTGAKVGDLWLVTATSGSQILGDVWKMVATNTWEPQGNIRGATGAQGPQGEKGDTGNSGVYIGTAAPTDPSVNVWINPDGAAVQFYNGEVS